MNEKAYRVLEYHKVIEKLASKAASALTKELIEKLLPSVREHEIKAMLAETTEAVSVIMRKGALPLSGFYDIAASLHLANKGGTLTMKQLLQILFNLQVARNAQVFLQSDLPDLQIIKGIADAIHVEKRLEDAIDRCILSEDEMADSASSKLKDIRRSIIRQNEAVRAKMNQILNSQDNRTLLQDALVTMRQGRYVIPVKQEHKGRFPGIVHDQSATGATLFIEPQAIVNLNNELRELELAEKIEIERILAELSAEVAAVHELLLNNQKLLLQLDFIFAKGKLSVEWNATEPRMNTDGKLRIKKGRHPLIDKKKVVPINIALGKEYQTLVITGPNTGGKTVTLKTVGLFVLLAQSGLHIPAADGSTIPILQKVYADIGDEQSIEQSLSTFSSHMNNITDIIANTGENTLVLLDELGAGTDPTEGAALAIAVLEHLYGVGALTMATTHYTELKKYALSTEGVENASMEFNVETLSPTYRLTIGTPGRSNAFEICQKLGLSQEIIDQARTLLKRGDIEFEDVISSIEQDKLAAEAERDEAIALKMQMEKEREAIEEQKRQLAEKKERVLKKAKDESREMVREAKEFLEQVRKELRELEKEESQAGRNRKYEEVRKKIRDVSGKYRDQVVIDENPNPVTAAELQIGDRVKVVSVGQNGEVITLPDDRGDLQVQVGALKLNVNVKYLMKIQSNKPKTQGKISRSKYGSLYRSKAQSVSSSINVRGENLDDAMMDVDKYLDDAYMAGLKEVTVIHGRGEGILREGLHNLFRTHKHVAKFRVGIYNEGGDGVTIVSLK